jgi:hypothetical protein
MGRHSASHLFGAGGKGFAPPGTHSGVSVCCNAAKILAFVRDHPKITLMLHCNIPSGMTSADISSPVFAGLLHLLEN